MDERTRRILEQEKDPRILQALLAQALEFIDLQKNLITKIQEEQALSQQSKFNLDERVKLLHRSIFGKSTEKDLTPPTVPAIKARLKLCYSARRLSQPKYPAKIKRKTNGL